LRATAWTHCHTKLPCQWYFLHTPSSHDRQCCLRSRRSSWPSKFRTQHYQPPNWRITEESLLPWTQSNLGAFRLCCGLNNLPARVGGKAPPAPPPSHLYSPSTPPVPPSHPILHTSSHLLVGSRSSCSTSQFDVVIEISYSPGLIARSCKFHGRVPHAASRARKAERQV